MLLAVMNDDPATFEQMWHWTRNTCFDRRFGFRLAL
jgi:endo-1,4-beta-D-glucanase Y